MWWRFSEDFLNQPFIKTIQSQCNKQNPRIGAYILDSITQITQSIARPISAPKKPSIAWRVMIEAGVMRPVSGGFSAVDWLTEQDLLGKCSPKPQKPPKQAEPKPPKPNANKTAARPNVYLTQGEFDSLKAKYTQGDIERALDHLSDYKTRTGKTYASDYRALLSWVFNAIAKEPQNSPQPAQQTQQGAPQQAPKTPKPRPDLTPEKRAENARRFRELLDKLEK